MRVRSLSVAICVPRASGDEPAEFDRQFLEAVCSPRERG